MNNQEIYITKPVTQDAFRDTVRQLADILQIAELPDAAETLN